MKNKRVAQIGLELPSYSWKMATFSIDKKILQRFRSACKERGRDMSWVLEQYMSEFIKHPDALQRKGKRERSVRKVPTVKDQSVAA